jgi:hypothetical protein
MCNCGQKRSSLKSNIDPAYRNTIKVRLIVNRPLVLNGNITGRTYIFKSKGDINWIDKKDFDVIKDYKSLVVV